MRDSRYDTNFLYFEEGPHKYTDTNGNEYKSVTTLIHDNYVPHFDKKFWLHKKAKELGITDGSNPDSPATRKQVAVMIYRGIKIVLQLIGKISI